MTDLDEQREQYSEALEQTVEDLRRGFAEIPEIHRAILFGSFVQGRRDLFTDLDVLVVMDSSDDFVTRTAELYRRLSVRVDLDLIVYTPDELKRMARTSFVREALAEGEVIYEKVTG